MKKVIIILVIVLGSCSSDNCASEKQKEADKYDELIELAKDDPAQRDILIRNKGLKLAQFDC